MLAFLVVGFLLDFSYEDSSSPPPAQRSARFGQMYRSYSLASNKVPDLLVENAYWESIRSAKVQIPINLTEQREIAPPPASKSYLKVVCIADIHSKLNESHELPDGDVLIIAGDLTNYGSMDEIENFNLQIGRRPHRHKLVIAGNHDLGWDKDENLMARMHRLKGKGTFEGGKMLEGVTYLEDQEITIEGIKFYGSPWHPSPGYPFYADRNGGLAGKWEKIPNNTDVLITHTPPVGYLDLYAGGEYWGCRHLLDRVEEVSPRFHVFGHVHYCNGAVSNGKTTFINAAQLRKGKIYEHSPIVFYIEKRSQLIDSLEER